MTWGGAHSQAAHHFPQGSDGVFPNAESSQKTNAWILMCTFSLQPSACGSHNEAMHGWNLSVSECLATPTFPWWMMTLNHLLVCRKSNVSCISNQFLLAFSTLPACLSLALFLQEVACSLLRLFPPQSLPTDPLWAAVVIFPFLLTLSIAESLVASNRIIPSQELH